MSDECHTKYNLDDIKISGEKPGMIIEHDGRKYEVELDLRIDEDQLVRRTSAWYYVDDSNEVYEVKNHQTLRELHEIFIDRYIEETE